MRTKFSHLAMATWLLWAATEQGICAQAQPPQDASAVQELTGPSQGSLDARNWRLDPAVFTEITPFTAPDIAIQLPLEQQEEAPVPQPSPPLGAPIQGEKADSKP